MSDNLEGLLPEARIMLNAGATIEDILLFLRENGCFQIQSIKVVRRLLDVDLREAKDIVHSSEIWADSREDADRLHDSLIEVLEHWNDATRQEQKYR